MNSNSDSGKLYFAIYWLKKYNQMRCFIFLVLVFNGHFNSPFIYAKQQEPNFEDVLFALEKSTDFYSRQYQNVNLDSIFGLRLCQGALKKGIQMANVRSIYIGKVKELHTRIESIAKNGYEQLKESKSNYFKQFEFLIKDEWFFMLPYQLHEKSVVERNVIALEDSLNEALSDKCMMELVGSRDSDTKSPCTINNYCWDAMFAKSRSGYHLTHQALFIMLAEKHGCKSRIKEKLGGQRQWNMHIKYLGSNIFHQMEHQYRQGFASEHSGKDLFIEQVVVCQMLGILECYNKKYLSLLLQWQDNSGCWKEDENDNLAEDATQNIKENTLSRKLSRKLNEEKLLDDGCASHFSGVATGTLGMYVYWFLNQLDNNSGKERKERDNLLNFLKSNYMQDSSDFALLKLRWVLVFFLISFSVYFCRKRLRNKLSIQYKKIHI